MVDILYDYTALHSQIALLQSHFNRLTVGRVPAEIWLEIFLLCQDGHSPIHPLNAPLLFTSVCQWFRILVLQDGLVRGACLDERSHRSLSFAVAFRQRRRLGRGRSHARLSFQVDQTNVVET